MVVSQEQREMQREGGPRGLHCHRPQTPTLSNTISGSGDGDSQVSVLVLEPQFVFAQRLLFVCLANWKSAQPLAPYTVSTCHQFTPRVPPSLPPSLRHSVCFIYNHIELPLPLLLLLLPLWHISHAYTYFKHALCLFLLSFHWFPTRSSFCSSSFSATLRSM